MEAIMLSGPGTRECPELGDAPDACYVDSGRSRPMS